MGKRWVSVFINYAILTQALCQYIEPNAIETNEHLIEGETKMTWCTTSLMEQYKCNNLSIAVQRDRALYKKDYLELKCKHAFDTEECMSWVDQGQASILALDAGEVWIGGRFHSLVPIMQQKYDGGFAYEYSVAVVKKDGLPSIRAGEGLYGMRGAKACFPLVGTLAGWILPIYKLMYSGGLKIMDCNNHVKSAIEYFGQSCAINSLIDMYNPIGDNSDKLCQLCKGGAGVRCTATDPYAGYVGALKCLLEAGDVAFVRQTTVLRAIDSKKLFVGVTEDNFELICTDGSRRPIRDWLNCHWGKAPADAIVTSSARDITQRTRFQNFILKMTELYGGQNQMNNSTPYPQRDEFANGQNAQYNPFGNQNDYYGRQTTTDRYGYNRQLSSSPTPIRVDENGDPIEAFNLFESLNHGTTDLLVQDATIGFRVLSEDEHSAEHVLSNQYVGDTAIKAVLGVRDCPIRRAKLCITSDPEKEKCNKMRIALKAAFLFPELDCLRAHSTRDCERSVASGAADFAVLDSGDMLHAAAKHKLVPFMTEVYPSGESWYYAVAVAKEQDPDTDITYLKNKYTCHTGIGMAAGWIYPLAYLMSNGWIRPYGCDGARAASEYFTKSCAPGALSTEYADSDRVPRDNLCHLCHGPSYRRCRRDANEDYFGSVGAVRCVVEGGGHVAFTNHLAPLSAAGGRRREWWARDLLYDDLQLLCPAGTRAKVTEYEKCNLGRVPGAVLMGRANHTELDVFANLMLYAQQFFGDVTSDEFSFSMFYSVPPFTDLIFSDSAVSLRPLAHHERDAARVAGPALLRAAKMISCDAPQALSYVGADPDFLSGSEGMKCSVLLMAVSLLAVFL